MLRICPCTNPAFIEFVDCNDSNRDEIREFLYRYFDQNQNVIWRDALVEHELLVR